jgi:hypothetical protein
LPRKLMLSRMSFMDKSALKSEQAEIVRDIVNDANLEQQQALLEWSKDLLAIRRSDDSVVDKVKAAVAATAQRKVIWPIVRVVLYRLKRLGWDERSWKARLGIGAALATVIVFGGQGAGIAALGTAIGVPLWIIFGAGGTFAGLLIDELEEAIRRSRGGNTRQETITSRTENS